MVLNGRGGPAGVKKKAEESHGENHAVLVILKCTERHSSNLVEGWAPTPTPASSRFRRRAKYREVQSQHRFNTLSK